MDPMNRRLPNPSAPRRGFGPRAILLAARLGVLALAISCRRYEPSQEPREATPASETAAPSPESTPPGEPRTSPGLPPSTAPSGEIKPPPPAPPERAGEDETARAIDPARLSEAALKAVGRTFEPVYFDDDSAELRFSSRTALDEYARWLIEHPQVWVTLAGHSDPPGSTEYNFNLAMLRANAVKDRMAGLGVAAQRIFTIGFGEDLPASFGKTAGELALNRRVEFLAFVGPEGGILPAPTGPVPTPPGAKPPETAPATQNLPQ